MKTQNQPLVTYGTAVLALVLVFGLIFGWYSSDVNVTTEKVNVSPASCDLSSINTQIQGLQATINEDDDWKTTAIDLANEEWAKSDYKYIYRALENIDEKEDISKVVIKDSEVTSFDVDDQDAVVVQRLKVYYENLDGDDVKAYVNVETTIENGEVEDQTIELE